MDASMNDRVHRALDGDLAREDLTAGERAQAAALDAAADALRAGLDRLAPGDLDVAVMRRIRELGLEPLPIEKRPAVVQIVRSFWTPRELRLRLRPAYALAAAAALILFFFQLAPMLSTGTAVAPDVVASAPVLVQFRLEAVRRATLRWPAPSRTGSRTTQCTRRRPASGRPCSRFHLAFTITCSSWMVSKWCRIRSRRPWPTDLAVSTAD
jgi:hypothetical protein